MASLLYNIGHPVLFKNTIASPVSDSFVREKFKSQLSVLLPEGKAIVF
jgi:hypothetical protein